MSVKCLAIDDEPLALRQIVNYISRVPSLEIVESFDNAVEAARWLEEGGECDAIFLDINMPELSGVDFVKSLENPPIVVFTTAYSEYAIEGYKLDAIDYLLKPFSFEEFSRAAQKVVSVCELKALKSRMDTAVPVSDGAADKDCISIRADHKTSLVKYSNIVFLESVGEYVRINLADGTKMVTLFRLKNMESALPSDRFMRVHRSYIINLEHVTGYTKGRVFLTNNEYTPIGENYKETFVKFVEKIG